MSSDGWRPEGGGSGVEYTEPSSSSRSVPMYVLFLIMLGSGIFTLILLWICVQCIYHRRRVRRARADIERNALAAQQWEAAAGVGVAAGGGVNAAAKEVASDTKRCDAGDVELTYVVMAGEEHPTFLARPLKTSSQEPPPLSSSSLDHDAHDVPANPAKTSAS